MIISFKCKDTEALFNREFVRRFQSVEKPARLKLGRLMMAKTLEDLRFPQGNRLERLKGDRQSQYSIRINSQWRLCFTWKDDGAHNVEIVDYH
jgi:proteic killer suppression protein